MLVLANQANELSGLVRQVYLKLIGAEDVGDHEVTPADDLEVAVDVQQLQPEDDLQNSTSCSCAPIAAVTKDSTSTNLWQGSPT